MNKYRRGFTLIEVLIALSIFAILATITASTLYYAFNNRARVNEQVEQLSKLQLAISIIQQDTTLVIERGVRGNEMHPFAAFIGLPKYIEFTRDGVINPNSIEQRSELKRIAYVCENNQLLHRTWPGLDVLDRANYEDKILLNNVKDCHFNYLNQSLQTLSEWREQAVTQNQQREPIPKAIQVNLTFKEWGEMNMLFIIPEAAYGF